MSAGTDLETLREQAILSSLAGFPFLLVYGLVWLTAAALSYVVPRGIAPWLYMLLGLPAAPLAIAIEKRVGYLRVTGPDPMLPLTLQLLFVQVVAVPAVLLVWDVSPTLLPVAFAAVVGAHFLPFQWVYRTPIYAVLGVVVAVGPYVLTVVFGEDVLHYTGFFVGPVLLVGALAVRAHAQATWRASKLRP